MTNLNDVLQRIPPLSDCVHNELRKQALMADSVEEKKKCVMLMPFCYYTAPYTDSSAQAYKTLQRIRALSATVKGRLFGPWVNSIRHGNLGSIVPRIESNPSLLVKHPRRHTIVDALLGFIEKNMSYWNTTYNDYARFEKQYSIDVLNRCFQKDILLNHKYNHLKQRWTTKVGSIPGLLGKVDLPFYVRVYTFNLQDIQGPTLQITNEEVPLQNDDIDFSLDTPFAG